MTTASSGTRSVSAVGAARADCASHSAPTARALASWGGLVWTLVSTEFKVRYHGTIGGFVWALLKPITMFVLLMGVFSFLFASDPDYKFNLIVGLFLWDFFAEGTKAGLASLHARGFLLTRARFPLWTLVVTSVSNAAITLAVFCVLILGFLAIAGRPPSAAAVLMFAGYVVALTLIVVGFSLGASVLFLRYRDLNQVWEVAIQGGFFVAPIIYPLGILPERFHVYLYVWPPTPVIEFAREVLIRGTAPTLAAHLMLAAVVFVILGIGLLVFRRLSPRAAETL
jgi:lipopolysaccharide transport system permease protein